MTYHPNTNRRHRRILNLIARKLLSHYRHGIPPEIHTINNTRNPYEMNGRKRTVIPAATKGSLEERATILSYLMSIS